jgi:CDP-paratose 2-epimerase
MKKILITGGCGFVGSTLALSFKSKYPEYQIFAFDNLKRRGSELNIPRLKSAGVEFVHGDIRSKEDFDDLPLVDLVIEAAAEPSVLAGLEGSTGYLLNTNLQGTIHCLEFARRSKASFIFLSTSRIYPMTTIDQMRYVEGDTRFNIASDQIIPGVSINGLAESFPLEGSRSLYGASKLASELMVTEYDALLGVPAVINRCGVITGPYQMGKVDQGVVVLWVAKHFWKQKLGYFGYGGTGKQVRDMLHADDLFRLVDWQAHHFDAVRGQTFNAGGGNEVSVSLLELTALCEEITGNKIDIQRVVETRTADIPWYITDNTKITATTGWKPEKTPKDIIFDIYNWIRENESTLKPILG